MDPNNAAPQQPVPLSQAMETDEGGGSKKKILSIVIGLLVLGALFAAIYIFVVPRFFNASSGKAELVYWGLWEDPKIMNEIIADFNKQYPDIKITYKKQDITSFDDYVVRLTTRIDQGKEDVPDIFRYHSSWPIQLRGYLLPLPSDVVSSLELDTQYYNVIKKDLQFNGAYYGVPLQVDTLALFINDDIYKGGDFASVPDNWNSLADAAVTLTVPDETGKIKTAGVALGTFDNISHASDILSMILVQNRANLYDIAGTTKKNAVDALGDKFYARFTLGDANGAGKTWDNGLENSKVAFTKGNLAMFFGYSWDIFEIQAKNPSLKFSVVPVPHINAERSETIASYWVEGVSSKSKHQKEAFIFLKYLGQKSTLQKLYKLESQIRSFGELYPRRDMKSLLSSNPLLKTFLDQADNATSTPFASDTYDGAMNASLNLYMGNAVNEILGGTSPETAIDTLGAGEAKVLSNYALPATTTKK